MLAPHLAMLDNMVFVLDFDSDKATVLMFPPGAPHTAKGTLPHFLFECKRVKASYFNIIIVDLSLDRTDANIGVSSSATLRRDRCDRAHLMTGYHTW